MAKYRITSPEGDTFEVNAPDGASEAEVLAYAKANFPKAESFPQTLGRGVLNAGAGALRGAGSIGSTLLTPYDYLAGNTQNIGNPERRKAMDEALQSFGADPKSIAFQGGKLGAEISGTLPLGGLLAKPVSAIAPGLGQAIATGGMTTGAGALPTLGAKALDMGTRMLGGAATGAVTAGAIDPSSTGAGAAIGAALPPGIKALGMMGGAIGSVFRSNAIRNGEDLARALDLLNPADRAIAVAKLRGAQELVPGSSPTVAQVLQTPQAGILQRVVHDSAGGGELRNLLASQNAARLQALESVAPTNPLGRATAQSNLGDAIQKFAIPARASARSATSDLYNAVPQDEALLYLPELSSVRDKYFGRGSFTDRSSVDRAVNTARAIGTVELPGVTASKGTDQTLAQAVKAAGGINRSAGSSVDFRGELNDLMQGNLGRFSFANKGKTIDNMADRMHEAGFIPDRDPVTLINYLRDSPDAVVSGGKSFKTASERAMGDAPLGERVPVKVSLKDFESLRSSIGQEQRLAGREGNDKAAKALGDMRTLLDDRINQVVSGDGAIDEVLPAAWADALSAARASKVAEVKQFGTGPQTAIFRKGADGQPIAQGGEIAAKFWGQRPGLKEDVQAFRTLIADNPKLLGQFRSMVTTEGASTAPASGNLSVKFVQWFKQSLPGIKEAFDKDEVMLLGRIAADIKRAESAAAAGMGRGSNTYQNASNALDIGLLGSPVVKAVAGRVPLIGRLTGPAVDFAAESATKAKAKRLAGLLSSPNAAADALGQVSQPGLLANPALWSLFYRGVPAIGAD